MIEANMMILTDLVDVGLGKVMWIPQVKGSLKVTVDRGLDQDLEVDLREIGIEIGVVEIGIGEVEVIVTFEVGVGGR